MNGRLLYTRRTELGMSIPALARSAGVAHRLIDTIESNRLTDGTIPIGTLRALAAALGLDPGALLESSSSYRAPAKRVEVADGVLLGNILSRVKQSVTRGEIAMALGWDGARIEEAVDDLKAALPATGQCLLEDLGGMTVAPASDPDARAAATELQTGLIEEEPRRLELIWSVWCRGRPTISSATAADTELVQELIASRVLSIDNAGNLILAPATYAALAPAIPGQVRFSVGDY